MNAGNTAIDELAERIRRYTREHPHAADTLEGVAVWWLSGSGEGEWLGNVRKALEHLVSCGDMGRKTLVDGTVIYERSRER